mmetsp:Transcript_13724/g.21534  ORF Transcript_13724/g.21534 Transcript_13724/m.21534 type:complete len:214 (-) Transcript_13724:41-682(-)
MVDINDSIFIIHNIIIRMLARHQTRMMRYDPQYLSILQSGIIKINTTTINTGNFAHFLRQFIQLQIWMILNRSIPNLQFFIPIQRNSDISTIDQQLISMRISANNTRHNRDRNHVQLINHSEFILHPIEKYVISRMDLRNSVKILHHHASRRGAGGYDGNIHFALISNLHQSLHQYLPFLFKKRFYFLWSDSIRRVGILIHSMQSAICRIVTD